jgi:hypothetical protein
MDNISPHPPCALSINGTLLFRLRQLLIGKPSCSMQTRNGCDEPDQGHPISSSVPNLGMMCSPRTS